ncbi:hypothetical protein GCM10020295_02760 [Streptomyces cinereospinus]
MNIREFEVERWMDQWEETCAYNLAETCVRSITTGELLGMSGRREEILAELEATPSPTGRSPAARACAAWSPACTTPRARTTS